MAFSGYVERKAPEHSVVVYSALQELKQATSDLYKLDGKSEDWDWPSWQKLHVVVRFRCAMRRIVLS
jgi:hypothetical protein